MSLSSLPTELLRQIIESSAPPTFHSTTYRERQTTLRALSLVSRLFRSIAQPLLFGIVWIKSHSQLDKMVGAIHAKGWQDTVREAILEDSYGIYTSTQLKRLARNGQGLRSLTFDSLCDNTLDSHALRAVSSERLFTYCSMYKVRRLTEILPDLTNLQLSGSISLSSPVTLKNLSSFSFNHEALDNICPMLDPAFLPSLRHLSLIAITEQEELYELSHSRLSSLVPQLSTLAIDSDLIDIAPDYLISAFDRTIFDYALTTPHNFATWLTRISNLRILGLFRSSPISEIQELLPLTLELETQNPIRLRSIYLDSSLQNLPSSHSASDTLSKLILACSKRGVDVVYEEQPRDFTIDSYFSAEFCRRQTNRCKKQ